MSEKSSHGNLSATECFRQESSWCRNEQVRREVKSKTLRAVCRTGQCATYDTFTSQDYEMRDSIAYIDTVCCYRLVTKHCVIQLFHFLLRSVAFFYLNAETRNDTLNRNTNNSAVRECWWRGLVNMYAHVTMFMCSDPTADVLQGKCIPGHTASIIRVVIINVSRCLYCCTNVDICIDNIIC